jgi:hypothetical protein
MRHVAREFTLAWTIRKLPKCRISKLVLVWDQNMITKEQLVELFDNIAKTTPWDLSQPLVWSYFFTDASKEQLEHAASLLQGQGYRIADLFISDKEHPNDPDLWWLHAEKVEVHTPDSLDERNQALYRFADEQGLDSYDGMDVGPVDVD